MDLLSLIGADTPLRKVSSTRGGEWCGPCPFCGGKDRFRVQPERSRWWCRQCSPDERWEDAISYVRRRNGVSYRQALEQLDGLPPREPVLRPSLPASAYEPTERWCEAAGRAAAYCAEQLWNPNGARARSWLERRGLRLETLRRWLVGYSKGETVEGLWIPGGIVLPWVVRGTVCHLKIRRPAVHTSQPKYRSVRGGKPYLYGADLRVEHPLVLLTEGEFDTMLAWQELRDMVDIVSLGSCSSRLPARLKWELITYQRILVAYDADSAGDDGASQLVSLSGRMKRIRPLTGDLSDFHLAGGSLRDWLSFHMR